MPSIQVMGVSKSYGSKRLFEDVTVNFTERRRYGLTGPNGAGKSTFLKILSADMEADNGDVAPCWRLTTLPGGVCSGQVLDVSIDPNVSATTATNITVSCALCDPNVPDLERGCP